MARDRRRPFASQPFAGRADVTEPEDGRPRIAAQLLATYRSTHLRVDFPERSMPLDDADSPCPADPDAAATGAGDRARLDAMFIQAYDELRRLARVIRRDDASATIDPTALVHEAWIKLAASPHGAARAASPLEFRHIMGRAMRQVLVDAARQRYAIKRGGRDAVFVTFGDDAHAVAAPATVAGALEVEVLALDAAITALERMNRRHAAIVESRFFCGLDVAETADLLGVSESTVAREWRVARAWLAAELRSEP